MNYSPPGVAVNGNPGLEDTTPLVLEETNCRSRLILNCIGIKSVLSGGKVTSITTPT